MKFKLMDNMPEFGTEVYAFRCPGCKNPHYVSVKRDGVYTGPVWNWNGSIDAPTIDPSLLITTRYKSGPWVCHSFIRDGQIQFLSDCTHALAGSTVELPEWDQLLI